MEIRLSKQQAFELAAFLKVPSNKFATVTEARKASSIRNAFEKGIEEYYRFFENLAKVNNKTMESYREKYQTFISKKVKNKLPTQEQSQAKASELDKQLREELQAIEKDATKYRLKNGNQKTSIKLDRNDFDFLSQYFDKEAVKFQMWQDTQKLEEMANLLESVSKKK